MSLIRLDHGRRGVQLCRWFVRDATRRRWKDRRSKEVADVVEEGPEEHEGSEAEGRSVDDHLVDADEVLRGLEPALGDDRASDGNVGRDERGEAFEIGEPEAAADDARDDGEELEDDAVYLGVVGDLLGVDDDELLA